MSNASENVAATNDSVDQVIEQVKQGCNECITAVWIDKLLGMLRSGYYLNFFEKNEKWLVRSGYYGLYVLAILGLISSVSLPSRYDLSWGISLGSGVTWFFACIAVHYGTYKMLPTLSNIIKSTPTKLTSFAFLDCLAVIFGVSGLVFLIGGLIVSLKTTQAELFFYGLFLFIFCEYILSMCLNPSMLNIEADESTTAGQELIGLFSFCMKGFLKMVPIYFGSGIVFAVISGIDFLFMDFEYVPQILGEIAQISNFAAAALLPVIAYLIFLIYYFFIDISSAILSLPNKLEKN